MRTHRTLWVSWVFNKCQHLTNCSINAQSFIYDLNSSQVIDELQCSKRRREVRETKPNIFIKIKLEMSLPKRNDIITPLKMTSNDTEVREMAKEKKRLKNDMDKNAFFSTVCCFVEENFLMLIERE